MTDVRQPIWLLSYALILGLTLASCTAGRNAEGFNQSFVVNASYRGSKVDISRGDGLPCSKIVKKSALGHYAIADVGPDFLIIESKNSGRVLVPLADICFSMDR